MVMAVNQAGHYYRAFQVYYGRTVSHGSYGGIESQRYDTAVPDCHGGELAVQDRSPIHGD